MDETNLIAKLNSGESIPIESCHCYHCSNEWFMAAFSIEWMPSFCPYCGIRFIGSKTKDDNKDFTPKQVDNIEHLKREANILKEIREMFYGQNLQISGWHQNGELEAVDTFFEENMWINDDEQ